MELEKIMARMSGFDETKEILDLWLELFYLFKIVNKLISILPNSEVVGSQMTEEFFRQAIAESRKKVLERFPNLGVKFEDKKEE